MVPEKQSIFLVSIIFHIQFLVGEYRKYNIILCTCENREYQATFGGGGGGGGAGEGGGGGQGGGR